MNLRCSMIFDICLVCDTVRYQQLESRGSTAMVLVAAGYNIGSLYIRSDLATLIAICVFTHHCVPYLDINIIFINVFDCYINAKRQTVKDNIIK